MQLAGLPKVFIVLAVLVALHFFLRYLRAVRRQAKSYRTLQKSGPAERKPKDELIGEYVDFEEIKD